jgi:hypothetical protein
MAVKPTDADLLSEIIAERADGYHRTLDASTLAIECWAALANKSSVMHNLSMREGIHVAVNQLHMLGAAEVLHAFAQDEHEQVHIFTIHNTENGYIIKKIYFSESFSTRYGALYFEENKIILVPS